MTEHRIEPHKVTKPIQLLAAWLVGLILTNGIFLWAALHLEPNTWERGALVVASIINVPIFLLALFILQTRFRAELQEDTYYSEYLSKKTASIIRIDKNAIQDARIEKLEEKIIQIPNFNELQLNKTQNSDLNWSGWSIAINNLHPQFELIRSALKLAQIPLAEIFGNPNMVTPPTKWIIALNYHLPISNKIKILKVLMPFKFDGFQLWNPRIEADEREDVYIGSYDIVTHAKITPELEKLLATEVEIADFQHYYDVHLNNKFNFNE